MSRTRRPGTLLPFRPRPRKEDSGLLDVLIDALQEVKERSQENVLDRDELLADAYEYASGRLHVGLSSWQRGEHAYAMTCFRKAEKRLARAIGGRV